MTKDMAQNLISELHIDIKRPVQDCFQIMKKGDMRDCFPELLILTTASKASSSCVGIDYVLEIDEKLTVENKKIVGTVTPTWDDTLDKVRLEFEFESFGPNDTWTRLTIRIISPEEPKGTKWWIAAPSIGAISLLSLLKKGFANMQQAYASTATASSSMPISVPNTATVVSAQSTATTSILSTKSVLATMLATVMVVGSVTGIYVAEPDIFDNNLSSLSDLDSNNIETNFVTSPTDDSKSDADSSSASNSSETVSTQSISISSVKSKEVKSNIALQDSNQVPTYSSTDSENSDKDDLLPFQNIQIPVETQNSDSQIKEFDSIKCDTSKMISNNISDDVIADISQTTSTNKLLEQANNLVDTKQYTQAALFYYLAANISTNNPNPWNGIGYTQTQFCSNDSAIISYKQALNIDPDNTNAKIGLADYIITQVRLNKLSEDSLSSAEIQLLSINKYNSNTNALNALGNIESIHENYDKAINDYFEISLHIERKITTLNGIASAHFKAGNTGDAISFYKETLHKDTNNFDALSGLFLIHTKQNQPELAVQYENQLQDYTSQLSDLLTQEGIWLENHGQISDAKQFYDKAILLDPRNDLAKRLQDKLE